ncbi:MAG: hypothetical protein ACLS6G_14085 [Christensenellales bacterium]
MIEKALTFVLARRRRGIPVDALVVRARTWGICGALLAVGTRFPWQRKASGADGADRLRGHLHDSDEFISVSDGRGPSPVDVMIDTVGAALRFCAAALHVRERGEGGSRRCRQWRGRARLGLTTQALRFMNRKAWCPKSGTRYYDEINVLLLVQEIPAGGFSGRMCDPFKDDHLPACETDSP